MDKAVTYYMKAIEISKDKPRYALQVAGEWNSTFSFIYYWNLIYAV